MNMMQTAIITGATGLVGSYILRQLLNDPSFSKIISISRKDPGIQHEKLLQVNGSLDDPVLLEKHLKGDIIFCCLGTTIKKAGSQEAFENVDLNMPLLIAKIATDNAIPVFAVVSSLGANARSSNFYLRTKGKMEEGIIKLAFEKTVIVRPSMLLGKRDEFRFTEELGKVLMGLSKYILLGRLKKYRAIKAETVAKAMINLSKMKITESIFESDQVETYGSN